MTMGYSAVLLPQLQSINGSGNVLGFNRSLTQDSVSLTITITNEESWIAALSILAMVPGCWLSCILLDNYNNSTLARYDKYLTRLFLLPLVIVCVFAFTSQFSGINVVGFYSMALLTEVSGPENAYLATLVLDVAPVAFSIVACWMVAMYPRRLLMSISGYETALTLFALSACLLADYGKPWIPIVLLFIYTCTVTIELVPLPWLLGGELFTDTSTRAFGSALSSGFAFFFFFWADCLGYIFITMHVCHLWFDRSPRYCLCSLLAA
ncbi:hypothetical protein KQX54_018466 [Cotesia glomerata]|uniref:Uncharacterized protein n=1 Tax=Cotesia glomerata TaxID=32391 RepID=A0AAV7J7H2_COTGL|nr:hypothetical protein KQX54_018466 [Cotesia glomerata]